MTPAAVEIEMAKLANHDEVEPVELDETDDGLSAGLFLALTTQWLRAGMEGQHMGINYIAVAPTAAAFEIPLTPQRMIDLRDMEAEALQTFAEARK